MIPAIRGEGAVIVLMHGLLYGSFPISFMSMDEMMSYIQEQVDELNVLMLFDLVNHQDGIKVHSTAAPSAIAATQRLYDKGLVTQKDGGYLTPLGLQAAEHAQSLLTILTSKPGE